MKILHLTLKRKWFDMIADGIKREEYREIKPYWNRRLNQHFDIVRFKNGYGKVPALDVELKEIMIGLGVVEWGAPESKKVYILRLGNVISFHNPCPRRNNET